MAVSSYHSTMLAVTVAVAVVMLNLLVLAEGQIVNGSQIEDIRLVDRDGTTDGSQGRVEIKYNGQWGTICSSSWYTSEARVACRMLGFEDALCAVPYGSYFGRASPSIPTLMREVYCSGYESALDLCYFSGWGASFSPYSYCSYYYDDVGVVCLDEITTEEIGTPSDIRQIESSTTTLTIGWVVPAAPSWATARSFTIRYQSDQQSYAQTRTYYNSSFINATDVEMSYTLTSLTRDTQYSIQIRVAVQNSACYYFYYTYGNYSESVSFQTNATLKQSDIQVRLVPPSPNLHFLGRVEVLYNDQWGTVCDDLFYTTEANVICFMLNFTRGAVCSVSNAQFGQGRGPIWLDNVDCRPGDEILEDCNHNSWGNTSCSHREDVGVVCRPNTDDTFSAVQNLTVLSVGPTLISVGWSRYTFPPGAYYNGYQLQYTDSNGYTRTAYVTSYYSSSSVATQYTLRRLQIGEEYSISVRAFFQFSGSCYYNIYSAYSNNVTVTTMETAPTAPPRDFYVVAINRTAIEAEWDLPPIDFRGGFILGYKLFIQSTNGGAERTINITNNSTVYIVEGLQPATEYRLSVLAYTRVGDGPRSIHLTLSTLRFDPLITEFGYYGNGADRITRYTSSYRNGRVHLHCTSRNFTAAPPHWYFANGSRIGVRDRNFHVGHFPSNGTAVLKIADYRPLSYCDGGIFTCRVNNSVSGHSQEKNFTLIINSSPPSPDRPYLVEAQSTSITIGWSELTCNGGHSVNSFNIRYHRSSSYGYYSGYTYLRDIDPAQRNYTITGLQTNTYYSFSVQPVNSNTGSGSYSSALSATTLPPAPTSPRDVTARLVAPLKVEVRWRSPAVTNGDISHYYIYAIPLRSALSNSTRQTLKMALPGSARAGNITLVVHSITYQFRVSAAVSVDQTFNEGDLSPVSASTSLFVPKPGLPVPMNPSVMVSTNSSVSLTWNAPSPSSAAESIEKYLVSYSGEVEWRSSKGFLVQFTDSGETNVTTNSIMVSALVPGTTYVFKVSAITQSGRGAEIMLTGTTTDSVSLTYFQLRLGPIRSCFDFMESNTDSVLDEVRSGLVQEFSHLCPRCGVTAANIKNDEFSCRGGLSTQIIYRARMVGTNTYSAPGLVSLMQSWVDSGRASIMVQSSRLTLDPTCDTNLDSLYDTDCLYSPTKPPTAAPFNRHGVSAGEIAGILIGVVIILLLVALVVVIILKKWRPKVIRRYGRHRTAKSKDEDMYNDMPFTDDIDESNDDKTSTKSFGIGNK